MPGAGGGVFNLRQILVLLLVVALTVFLVRQVAWHALLAATGGILFVTAIGVYGFYPARQGDGRPSRALDPGRGTGLWWWLWGDGSVVLFGIWLWRPIGRTA